MGKSQEAVFRDKLIVSYMVVWTWCGHSACVSKRLFLQVAYCNVFIVKNGGRYKD